MAPDDLDLAATCVGVVERDDFLDGRAVAAGDVLVGLPSSGLHSNGFSLVRRIVEEAGLDLEAPYGETLRRHAPGVPAEPELESSRLADVLLAPTRVYALALLAMRARCRRRPGRRRPRDAHVTGGGLPGNVPRILRRAVGTPRAGALGDAVRDAIPGCLRRARRGGDRATFNGASGWCWQCRPGQRSGTRGAAEQGWRLVVARGADRRDRRATVVEGAEGADPVGVSGAAATCGAPGPGRPRAP